MTSNIFKIRKTYLEDMIEMNFNNRKSKMLCNDEVLFNTNGKWRSSIKKTSDESKNLQSNDQIKCENNETTTISSINRIKYHRLQVFDITLDNPCGFYINGILVNNMKIYIDFPNEMKFIGINCSPCSTIRNLKEEINCKYGVPVEKQTLKKSINQKQLENKKKIQEYKIEKNETINLNYGNEPIKIYINSINENWELNVSFFDPIYTIKERIKELYGFAFEKQTLMYDQIILENEQLLSSYKIKNKSTLELIFALDAKIDKNFKYEKPKFNFFSMFWYKIDYILKIFFKKDFFLLKIDSSKSILDLKQMISKIIRKETQALFFYYNNSINYENCRFIKDCFNCESEIIVAEYGDPLYLAEITREKNMKILKENTPNTDPIKILQNSLSFMIKKIPEIERPKKEILSLFKWDELYAVILYTTNFLYKELNKNLRESQNLEKWSFYLNKFIRGQSYLPFFKGTGYRGFPDYQDKALYRKGEIIFWKNISSISKKKQIAEIYTSNKGTLFEIDLISAKDISKISQFEQEDEIILMPYSYLEVIEVKDQPNQAFYVLLREIPAPPRALNLVFWVDDNPENNYEYAKNLEISGKSVVFAQSTQQALKYFHDFLWLFYIKEFNLKIVTDMVREENGVINYQAGIDLVEALFRDFEYDFKISCFCSDIKTAKKNAQKRGVLGKFKIISYEEDLKDFLYGN